MEEVKLSAEQKKIISAYCITFNGDHGTMVLQDMIDSYMGQTYVRNDPYHTAFLEGQRSVILGILEMQRIGNRGEVTQLEVKTESEGNDG